MWMGGFGRLIPLNKNQEDFTMAGELECLIRRVGNTTVVLEKTVYTFRPIPGTKYNPETLRNYNKKTGQVDVTTRSVPVESTSVCDVQNQEHYDYLLATGQYRPYDPAKAQSEANIERSNPFEGYAIEKYEVGSVQGYLAVNKKKKPYLYAGADGVWKEKAGGMNPWKTEIELFAFLKEEVSSVSYEDEDLEKTINEVGKTAAPETKKGKK
jgi:hypothetical protein